MPDKTTAFIETEGQTSGNDKSLGSFLKAARMNQGLDLTAIAQETRINLNNLIALEENNRAELPADVFSRGFVKLYAAYLNLDAQEAIRLFEKQWGANGTSFVPLAPQKSSPSLAWPGIIISLLLIALFFGVRFYYPGHIDDSGTGLTHDSPAKENNEISPASPPSLSPNVENKQAAISPPASPQETKITAGSVPPVMVNAEIPPTDTTSTTPANPPPPYQIHLQSLKQTKIKLALDGESAIEKNLLPGSNLTWQAAKSFDLTVDSTAGINLTVNGTTIPITTEAGQTITIRRP